MRINKLFLLTMVIGSSLISNAQSKITRIGIGDNVPGDFPLMNLVNYSKPEARISDFKGKWLILDYWFTGCGPCIASWPKLMQLQKKYGDKIQIMSVDHIDNQVSVENFIARRNKGSKEPYSIPSVTGDTILYKILPPSGYPTVVWIDADGKYRATTSGEDFNEANIEKVLNKQDIKSLTVNTTLVDSKKPFFLDGNGGSGEQMLWYSTVSRYSEKLRSGATMSANASSTSYLNSSGYVMAIRNHSLLGLVQYAYCDGPHPELAGWIGEYTRLPQTRIELRVKDPGRLNGVSADGLLLTDSLYTYQLISYQPRTMDQLKKMMREDLQRYFDLEFKWEKVKKQCLVLTAEDTTLLSNNNLEGRPTYGYNRDSDFYYMRDVPVSNFFGYLLEYTSGYYKADSYPLIDETGFKGGLDLIFKGITIDNFKEIANDYRKLDALLAKYKMHFKLEEREVNVLVITDAATDKKL